jgi:hypothetical protein
VLATTTRIQRKKIQVEYDADEDLSRNPRHSVLFKTVDLFSGLTRRRLSLKSGPTPSSDGFVLTVPVDSEDAYQIVERQLAHILFRTDPHARALFIEQYVEAIKKNLNGAVTIDAGVLGQTLRTIINILDTHRVMSLWTEIYPGSAELIQSLIASSTKVSIDDPHASILTLFMSLATLPSVPSGKLDRFRDSMKLALKRVEGKSYAIVLASARWLLVKLVDEVWQSARTDNLGLGTVDSQVGAGSNSPHTWKALRQQIEQQERAEALKSLLEQVGKLPDALNTHHETVAESSLRERGAEDESIEIAKGALAVNPNDDMFMQGGAEAMRLLVEQTMKNIALQSEGDDRLHKRVEAKVVFYDVTPAMAAKLPAPPPMSQEDLETVKRLRALFIRVIGRRRTTLDECGTEIDICSVIERRMTKLPIPCFRRQEKGQGFHAMLLLDQSVSMDERDGGKTSPTRLEQAYRACRIISRALDFPFVKMSLWGYTSLTDGQVDIARYDPKTEVYASPNTEFTGISPLHAGVQLAAAFMQSGAEAKHLFVLTDGRPVFARRNGQPLPKKGLIKLAGTEVEEARRHGVDVTGVMIGDDLGDEELGIIFGPRRFWKRLKPVTFGRDLVDLVAGSFISYLRSR